MNVLLNKMGRTLLARSENSSSMLPSNATFSLGIGSCFFVQNLLHHPCLYLSSIQVFLWVHFAFSVSDLICYNFTYMTKMFFYPETEVNRRWKLLGFEQYFHLKGDCDSVMCTNFSTPFLILTLKFPMIPYFGKSHKGSGQFKQFCNIWT